MVYRTNAIIMRANRRPDQSCSDDDDGDDVVVGIGRRNAASSSSSSPFTGSPGGRWAQSKKGGGGGRRNSFGRQVTYIRRINVVNNNNFGAAGNGGGKPGAAERTCWLALRIAPMLLAMLWLMALVAVTTGGGDGVLPSEPPHGPGKLVASKTTTEEGPAEAAPRSSSSPPPRQIFEPSLLGSRSPGDFQLYAPPRASLPPCRDPLDPAEVSYTLASQLSDDRVWMVRHHCERWGGENPISIAVFTDRAHGDVMSELTSAGCSDERLTLQVVEKTRYDPDGTEYPVNLLRNLALSAVRTSHVVYADVDFWPSSDLHAVLSNVAVRERFASDGRLAGVVPAFQMYRRCREYADCRERNVPSMPATKGELIGMIVEKAASAFDPTNRGGHGSTRYETWCDQGEGTFVDLGCIRSNRYEPYVAIRHCAEMPPFQEGFTGYGKNKMTVRRA
jgi:hypothetical protein